MIFSYIFFYLIKSSLNYVVYPLKVVDKFDKIVNLLSSDLTYTTLEIGTPPQIVNFYLSLNHYKIYITDKGCRNNNLFNIKNSKTLKFSTKIENNEDNDEQIILESLCFYDNIYLSKKKKFEKFPLYYSIDLKNDIHNLCGNIGLSIIQFESFQTLPEEFEYYSKYLRIQKNYFSFFNYKGNDYIINNIYLHQEFPDFFKDIKNISWTNPILRDNSLHWEISMKEIYYNNIHFNNKITFELNPLFELIIGNDDYKQNILKDFFIYYIDKKICVINEIKDYQIFECDSNKFSIIDIKKFPNLYMFNNDINHVFEIIEEELFILLNNKYYFKIVFPIKISVNNKWTMGKIFLRKYPVIFSPSNRLIGFYINPNEGRIKQKIIEIEINEDFSKTFYFYIIIIIVGIIFTCFGLYIGKKIFFQKYKVAKELTDDNYYDYDSEKNKNIYKKTNKNNTKYTSIEMNSKLENK